MKTEELRRIDRIINDLAKSVTTDVVPIIQPNNPEGGYYGVPRMVLCYIDILGLLFSGWNGKKKKEIINIFIKFKMKIIKFSF